MKDAKDTKAHVCVYVCVYAHTCVCMWATVYMCEPVTEVVCTDTVYPQALVSHYEKSELSDSFPDVSTTLRFPYKAVGGQCSPGEWGGEGEGEEGR